jgi:hypothetical protein
MKNNLERILNDFEGYLASSATISSKSQKSYLSYVRSLDKANEGQTSELKKLLQAKHQSSHFLNRLRSILAHTRGRMHRLNGKPD